MKNTIIVGDVRDTLPTLPADSVQCCVTSPPYFGLRDYGHDGQIGLEDTPEAYVAKLVEVFREVRRVLRDDGTLWLNLGDSYAGSGRGAWDAPLERKAAVKEAYMPTRAESPTAGKTFGLKPKDLVGIPWRVAFALQADGWYLRQDIIWHKPNPMPESVQDRCTKAHEYVFLLSKSERYFYDADAIRQPLRWQDPEVLATNAQARQQKRLTERILAGDTSALRTEADRRTAMSGQRQKGRGNDKNAERTLRENVFGANRRSVWTVTTKPYSGAHFATMPPELAETCILAGSRPGDLVFDPFGGAGTTAVVAAAHRRDWLLCELNPQYAEECAWPRIKQGWSPATKRPCKQAASGQRRLFEE